MPSATWRRRGTSDALSSATQSARRRTERPVRGDATYLVTGGLQGLGLLAAQWLADEGARHLLLAARSAPDAKARETIARLEADGVRVTTVTADVGSAPGVEALMQALQSTGAPLGGDPARCSSARRRRADAADARALRGGAGT